LSTQVIVHQIKIRAIFKSKSERGPYLRAGIHVLTTAIRTCFMRSFYMDLEPSEQSSKLSCLNGLLCSLGCIGRRFQGECALRVWMADKKLEKHRFRWWNTSSLLRIIITHNIKPMH